jgi:2'-5' RNA ligase
VSPLPTEFANHWWQRPGRTPGRELYHWHVLFHDQPKVHELAAKAQERLVAFPCLDLVPMEWLHLTTYIVGFVDELDSERIEVMISEAQRRLAHVAPIPVNLGRIYYHPQAVVLPIEPIDALNSALDAVRTAAQSAGCQGHTDTHPWRPHVSIAYPNRSAAAGPIIAMLGRSLPNVDVAIKAISLVAQTQAEHTWRWRPVAEVVFAG